MKHDFQQRNGLLVLSILCINCLLLAAMPAASEERAETTSDLHLTTGVSVLPTVMWGLVPMPVAFAANLDMGKLLRLSLDFTHHVFAGVTMPTMGAGVVFRPVGKNAPASGGFQLKVPITGEIGVAIGDVEVDDGYDESLRWFLFGAAIGADLTWWKAGGAGFCIAAKAGYLFRADVGSDYVDGYGHHSKDIGLPQFALMFGVAL